MFAVTNCIVLLLVAFVCCCSASNLYAIKFLLVTPSGAYSFC